jgi:hypothetical protein
LFVKVEIANAETILKEDNTKHKLEGRRRRISRKRRKKRTKRKITNIERRDNRVNRDNIGKKNRTDMRKMTMM